MAKYSIEQLHADIQASLRYEQTQGVLTRERAAEVVTLWFTIAEDNHQLDWWDLQLGDSPEECAQRYAEAWLSQGGRSSAAAA